MNKRFRDVTNDPIAIVQSTKVCISGKEFKIGIGTTFPKVRLVVYEEDGSALLYTDTDVLIALGATFWAENKPVKTVTFDADTAFSWEDGTHIPVPNTFKDDLSEGTQVRVIVEVF